MREAAGTTILAAPSETLGAAEPQPNRGTGLPTKRVGKGPARDPAGAGRVPQARGQDAHATLVAAPPHGDLCEFFSVPSVRNALARGVKAPGYLTQRTQRGRAATKEGLHHRLACPSPAAGRADGRPQATKMGTPVVGVAAVRHSDWRIRPGRAPLGPTVSTLAKNRIGPQMNTDQHG
jgi:hypothetical protein